MGGKLDVYRAKRSAGKTPEPFAGTDGAPFTPGKPLFFVVQKHDATRLHYDFRLEWGGTLRSWAIPKGPSFDPAEKRLAMQVEDHPVEYGDFEGVIPDGNYGAGPVVVWDRGVWIPREDPEEGLRIGKLSFDLKGYKLHGHWHLFRTKGGSPKEWLLIKKPDAYAGHRTPGEESVLSGLTVEEVAGAGKKREEIRAALVKVGAPRKKVKAESVGLMLAETADQPFSSKDFVFEIKYDGYRALAAREDGQARILYRRGSEVSATYPEIAKALSMLPHADLVLDGEIVVLGETGRPVFNTLQKRGLLTHALDIKRAALETPATLFVFDLMGYDEFDLRPLPLVARKQLLERVLPKAGPLRFVGHVEKDGERFVEEVRRLGLEGAMAKKAASPYRAGRSQSWLKLKIDKTGDFAIVGFTEPEGARTGMGAVHVGAWKDGGLVWAGKVGTGFNEKQLAETRALLEPDRIKKPAVTGEVPKGRENVWVAPKHVAEVRYKEWTPDGSLRHPVFVGLREDKRVAERDIEPAHGAPAEPAPAARTIEEAPVEKKVPFTNRDKVFWPDEGYTKGDLIDYYASVARWILPYLKDRPVVMTRYPDGIAGKSFFQKDAPSFAPTWLRTERTFSEHATREIDYFVCDDVESLLYVVNLGSIPLHVWASRVSSIQRPDWCLLDLDPKGAPFADVVTVALAIRKLCDELGVPHYVKTSGSTGLHVLLPLGGLLTHDESKSLGELLARVVAGRLPEIATVIRLPQNRGGRVYLDFLQNGHGKLMAGPLCVRPLPGAPVSTPLAWSEVTKKLDMKRFTIKTVPKRLEKLGEDPMARVLVEKPDWGRALARLATAVQSAAAS